MKHNMFVAAIAVIYFLVLSQIVIAEDSLFIDEDGNVGIGTTGPGYKLDVNGQSQIRSGLKLKNASTGTGSRWIDFVDGDGSVDGNIYYNFEYNRMSFGTSDGSNRHSRMVIDTNGNVGIGTSNPTKALTVSEDDSDVAVYGGNSRSGHCNYGVYGDASGAGTCNAGVKGRARGTGSGITNIGVWGQAYNGDTNWAGWFQGNIYATGYASFDYHYDHTPYYEGDALSEISKIKGSNGEIDHSTLPKFVHAELEVPVFEESELIEISSDEAFETVMADKVKTIESEGEDGEIIKNSKQKGFKKVSTGFKAKDGKIVEVFEKAPVYETEQVATKQLRKDVYLDEKTGKVYKKTGDGDVFEKDGKIFQQNQTGTKIEEQRDLGAMISILTVAVQQLNEEKEALRSENIIMKDELCSKDSTYSFCKNPL